MFLLSNVSMGSPATDYFTCCIIGYHNAIGTPVQTYTVRDFDSSQFYLPPASLAIDDTGVWELRCRLRSWQVKNRSRAPTNYDSLFPLSAPPATSSKLKWARNCDNTILRRCPTCKRDSIIGDGCPNKQAHDEHHDWIKVRRGRCPGCGMTCTFLPLLSLPYTSHVLASTCPYSRQLIRVTSDRSRRSTGNAIV